MPRLPDPHRPLPLVAEAAARLALAIVAARAASVWELAALAWLALIAVPLAFTDVAVHRLPDPLTAAAFTGTLAFLAAAALTGHQPGHLARAAIGAAALTCFYLVLFLIRPGDMGPGDVKLAASIGLVLGWIGWRALLAGTLAGFTLAAVYGGVLLATHRASRTSQLPLGPFILLRPRGHRVLIAAVGPLVSAAYSRLPWNLGGTWATSLRMTPRDAGRAAPGG